MYEADARCTGPGARRRTTAAATPALAALRSRGVVIDAGIQEAPWGRFVTFDDPDGNGLVLQATATPAPPAGG